MSQRELPKVLRCPRLAAADVDAITSVCFEAASDRPFEMLVVLGSNIEQEKIASHVVEVLRRHPEAAVVFTGGIANYDGSGSTVSQDAESEAAFRIVNESMRIDDRWVLVERRSRNTLENFQFVSGDITKRRVQDIALVSHSYASGRARMTAAAVLPHVNCVSCFGVDVSIGGCLVTADGWFECPTSRDVVWAELTRITRYGGRGDINLQDKSEVIRDLERRLVAT